MIGKALAAAGAALLVAVPAQAQMVTAQNPQSLVKALQAAGHSALLTTDKVGDPMIQSEASGSKFRVLFYNCTKNRDCATVQFTTGFDMKTGPSLARINEWNKSQRFGRAYLDDEGDPILQMDVDLDDGGLSQLLFIDNVEFWEAVVNGFKKHIGWGG